MKRTVGSDGPVTEPFLFILCPSLGPAGRGNEGARCTCAEDVIVHHSPPGCLWRVRQLAGRACVCTCVCMQHAHVCVRARVCTRTRTHMCARACMCVCECACMHLCVCTCVRASLCTCECVCTHVHVHVHEGGWDVLKSSPRICLLFGDEMKTETRNTTVSHFSSVVYSTKSCHASQTAWFSWAWLLREEVAPRHSPWAHPSRFLPQRNSTARGHSLFFGIRIPGQ